MQLQDLQAFLHVAENRSFTTAAARLDVPTSTLSRRVARLEKQLGVQLLHRTTRDVSPTHTGLVILERARNY